MHHSNIWRSHSVKYMKGNHRRTYRLEKSICGVIGKTYNTHYLRGSGAITVLYCINERLWRSFIFS